MKSGTRPPLRSVRLLDQVRERIRYIELPWMQQIGRPKSPVRIPVVLSRTEVARLLEQVEPTFAAMVALLYGAGLRLMECLRLRAKDLDFDRKILIVREGKGSKGSRGDAA